MADDVLIGAISGYDLGAIRCWLNSLDRCGFAGKRVMLVCNGDQQLLRELKARRFEVVTYQLDPVSGGSSYPTKSFQDEDISADRFYLMWQYLASQRLDDYRYVISVDVRDAIFQSDPTQWLSRNLDDKLLNVSSETVAYEDEEWNSSSLLDNFGAKIYERMRKRLVWNAGVIAGMAQCFRDLCLNIHLLCRSSTATYSDQAALNILLSLEPYQRVTKFSLCEDGWACHAGTLFDPMLPAKIRATRHEPPPCFDGCHVYTASGEKYAIVHQYDRVPQWNDAINAEYGKTS